MSELALILFTVLIQLAVGALVTLTVMELLGKEIKLKSGKTISLSVLVISATSLVVSLGHLGHPMRAYTALGNLGTSWLSREILVFAIFFLLTIVYWMQWKEDNLQLRKTVGIVGSVVGILGIIVSGLIYIMPAMPAWNSLTTIIFFLLTASLLGPVFVFMILKWQAENEGASIAGLTLVILILSVLVSLSYVSTIANGGTAQALTVSNMLMSASFWLRIIIGWFLPIVLFAYYVYSKKQMNVQVLAIAFLLLIVGELLGREVFYNTIVALQFGL